MDELTLGDYFAILRRWKKLFVITTIVLAAISLTIAAHWVSYRSTAVIQIEQPQITATATDTPGIGANELIKSAADQLIGAMQQKVLSTGSLIEIITKFDLYAEERKNTPVALVAEGMRKKIKVDIVANTLSTGVTANKDQLYGVAFNLSFDHPTPLLAQQVANELASRFLDEDLRERSNETQETSAFLAKQITELETSMSDQEKKIAEFQKEKGIMRPETLAFNQQAAESLTLNLQNLDAQITTNEGTIGSIQAQLAGIDPYSRVISDGQLLTTPSVQLKALQTQYSTLTAQYGPEHPDVIKVRHQIEALKAQIGPKAKGKDSSQLKARIADLRTNLEAAKTTYGPDHPDVIALQTQLQKLESQQTMERQGSTPFDDGVVADADNPAYLQFVSQLHAAEEQRKSLVAQRVELQAQQQKYQAAITQNPEAEQQMAELSRDYENAQLRYRELKEKKMAADMQNQMQKDRTGQRLNLIDPPELPLSTHPSFMVRMLGALLISLFASIASVVVAQLTNQGIVGPRTLTRIVGVAPLVVIPHISTSIERNKRLFNSAQDVQQLVTKRLSQ